MKHKCLSALTSVAVGMLLFVPSLALAATAPPLGAASAYGVASSTFTGNGAATNVIGGSVCYTRVVCTSPDRRWRIGCPLCSFSRPGSRLGLGESEWSSLRVTRHLG
jgi:hypothetical protein